MKYWLWVWGKRSGVKNGWGFDSKEEAELYFYCYFKDEPVQYEITYEA